MLRGERRREEQESVRSTEDRRERLREEASQPPSRREIRRPTECLEAMNSATAPSSQTNLVDPPNGAVLAQIQSFLFCGI